MNCEYFPFGALKIEVDRRSIWCGPNWMKNNMNAESAKPYWFHSVWNGKNKDNFSGPELTEDEISQYVTPILELQHS